jgi:hypothetical protein
MMGHALLDIAKIVLVIVILASISPVVSRVIPMFASIGKIIRILLKIFKSEKVTISTTKEFYNLCTSPHPKLKIIPHKKYIVALLNASNYKVNEGPHRKINKATARGYKVKIFACEEFIDDMIEINTSSESRQGKPMASHYLEKDVFTKGVADKSFYGVFDQRKLVAYCYILKAGDITYIGAILGHNDYLKDGIMYLLLDRIIDNIDGWFMYDTFMGNTPGLEFFKKNMGFKSYNVKWAA